MASNQEMRDLITCSLCFELYDKDKKTPKGLPCYHSFCLECLEMFVKDKFDTKLPCPLCQTKFKVPSDGPKALPTNIMARQLMENLPRESMEKMGKEKIVKLLCEVHKKKCDDFMCGTCLVPLCEDCLIGLSKGNLHSGHDIGKKGDIVEQFRQEADSFLSKIDRDESVINVNVKKVGSDLEKSRDEVLKEARERAQKVYAEVDGWLKETEKSIKDSFAQGQRNLKEYEDSYNTNSIKGAIQQVNVQLDSLNVTDAKQMLSQLQYENLGTLGSLSKTVYKIGELQAMGGVDLGKFKPVLPELQTKVKSSKGVAFPVTVLTPQPNASPSLTITTRKPQIGAPVNIDLGFRAEYIIGLDDNKIILTKGNKLQLYSLVNGSIKLLHETQTPPELGDYVHKFFLQDGRIALRYILGSGSTDIMSNTLQKLTSYSGDYGRLMGVTGKNELAYSSTTDQKVRLYTASNHDLVMTLKPQRLISWSDNKFLCYHPKSGHMAVYDNSRGTLDIFDSKGSLQHHTDHGLATYTDFHNTITCNEDHIFISHGIPSTVSVFNWQAQLITMFDKQALNIKADYIQAVRATRDNQLMLAEGNGGEVTSVNVYKLS